ncbi:MAG: nuclear transport factor 2 family protein [Acidobacteriota bacterium]|nr:nuclear transport factor 2 family protein [Acidobacteriota bacterium]
MTRILFAVLPFLALVVSGLARAVQPDDAALIRTARRAQNVAFARRDFASAAQTWTNDVSIRTGLGSTITGRAAYLRAFADDSVMDYERTPTEVVISKRWPLAYETGTWVGRAHADTATRVSGRYAAQWVKADGAWLIRSEVFVTLECVGAPCSRPAVTP